jgi:hypothetical protein
MKLFEDNYTSMYQELELPIHDYEDARAAGEYHEDQWVEGGHHLLTSVLFTIDEIMTLFI